jgi:hypothetical protein
LQPVQFNYRKKNESGNYTEDIFNELVLQGGLKFSGVDPVTGQNLYIKTDKLKALNPELDKEGLIRDRKVQGGDTRTYKVSFEKIKHTLPGFQCEWSVERGVNDLVTKLQEISLDNETFKKRGFYRLQQLEYLYENGLISDDLSWIKKTK